MAEARRYTPSYTHRRIVSPSRKIQEHGLVCCPRPSRYKIRLLSLEWTPRRIEGRRHTIIAIKEEGFNVDKKLPEERQILAVQLDSVSVGFTGVDGNLKPTFSFAPSTSQIICAPLWYTFRPGGCRRVHLRYKHCEHRTRKECHTAY